MSDKIYTGDQFLLKMSNINGRSTFNPNVEYQPNTIVTSSGSCFISKTLVPPGTNLGQTDYWLPLTEAKTEYVNTWLNTFLNDFKGNKIELTFPKTDPINQSFSGILYENNSGKDKIVLFYLDFPQIGSAVYRIHHFNENTNRYEHAGYNVFINDKGNTSPTSFFGTEIVKPGKRLLYEHWFNETPPVDVKVYGRYWVFPTAVNR